MKNNEKILTSLASQRITKAFQEKKKREQKKYCLISL